MLSVPWYYVHELHKLHKLYKLHQMLGRDCKSVGGATSRAVRVASPCMSECFRYPTSSWRPEFRPSSANIHYSSWLVLVGSLLLSIPTITTILPAFSMSSDITLSLLDPLPTINLHHQAQHGPSQETLCHPSLPHYPHSKCINLAR